MKPIVLAFAALIVLGASGVAKAQYPQPQNRPWNYNGQPGTYRPEWDRYPTPDRGACFFTDANFRGRRFCVRAGDRLPFLPGGYGHSISSIRTFGRVRVTAFAARNFSGPSVNFGTVPDLGYTSNGPFRGWNDRISSIVVR